LVGLIENVENVENENIVYGGGYNFDTLQIEPTIINGVTWDSSIMREEIFGPVLPVLTYSSAAEAVKLINSKPRPLALYVFTSNKQSEKYFLHNIPSGGGCINDTVVHLSVPRLPFGGVGESGMGSYHGKAGFDAFTHYRSVLHKSRYIDIPLRYAPYADWAFKLLKKL
jgi:aldehyde dehydrogenase (NAD+)